MMPRELMNQPDAQRAGKKRIETLDALRGIAALAVAWFHFSGSQGLNDSLIAATGAYGWLGVHVFFVISGFVIPYSLHRADYHLRDYGHFLIKRIVRLDPPYIATIIIIIALGYLSPLMPGFHGEQFSVSAQQVLLHVAYINVFFGYPWLNIVFWSLAIEFQYYLAIGLLFPLIASRQWSVRLGTLAGLSLLAFMLPFPAFVFHYLFLFMLGIITFQRHTGKLNALPYWIGFALLVTGLLLTLGAIIAAVAAATALAIALVRIKSRVLAFFGKISYSLYLLHVPIGAKAINLGFRFVDTRAGRAAVLIVALGITIAASYLFYLLLEKPAQQWSSAFKFGPRSRDEGGELLIDQQAL